MGGRPKPGGKPDKRLGGNPGGKTGKTVGTKSTRAGKGK